MGRVDHDHRGARHCGKHALARAIETERAQPRFDHPVALGLAKLLLDFLFAHSMVAPPQDARPGKIATAITAASLIRLFKNSVQPRAPNTRLRPLRNEMREASGKILSGTMRGVLCAREARTPATVRRIIVGKRKCVLASTSGPARARTSSPRSIRQPAGSSMRPMSAVRRASARVGMTNMSITRAADNEAKSGASRE